MTMAQRYAGMLRRYAAQVEKQDNKNSSLRAECLRQAAAQMDALAAEVERLQALCNPAQDEAKGVLLARLHSLKALLGTDAPEVRGWAPVVQQGAQSTVNAAIRELHRLWLSEADWPRLTLEQERAHFSEWIVDGCPFDKNVGMVEHAIKTEAAWSAWQGRAALRDWLYAEMQDTKRENEVLRRRIAELTPNAELSR